MLKINLDLDGVAANFCDAACKLFGVDHIDSHRKVNCVSEYIGVDKKTFWKEINRRGYKFWAEIEPYPWLKQLVNLVRKYDNNFFLLTAPSDDPECEKGKKIWISKHIGIDRYVFTKARYKYRLSFEPNSVLIDDSLKNILQWNQNQDKHNIPGYGIIFPQPWNDHFVKDKISYLDDVLDELEYKLGK